jgi:hypothetical protein
LKKGCRKGGDEGPLKRIEGKSIEAFDQRFCGIGALTSTFEML